MLEIHSICAGSFNEFVGLVLQLSVIARRKFNIVYETRVADRPTIDRDRSTVIVESFLYNTLQKQVEECWKEKASMSDADSCLEEIPHLVAQVHRAFGMVIEGLGDLHEPFYVQSSEDVPEAIMLCSINAFLKSMKMWNKSLWFCRYFSMKILQ